MQDFLQGLSQKDEKIESLVRMGFPKDEAEMAIVRCGMLSIEVSTNVFLVMSSSFLLFLQAIVWYFTF